MRILPREGETECTGGIDVDVPARLTENTRAYLMIEGTTAIGAIFLSLDSTSRRWTHQWAWVHPFRRHKGFSCVNSPLNWENRTQGKASGKSDSQQTLSHLSGYPNRLCRALDYLDRIRKIRATPGAYVTGRTRDLQTAFVAFRLESVPEWTGMPTYKDRRRLLQCHFWVYVLN